MTTNTNKTTNKDHDMDQVKKYKAIIEVLQHDQWVPYQPSNLDVDRHNHCQETLRTPARVQCPSCKRLDSDRWISLALVGWSAIVCPNCKAELHKELPAC